MTPVAHPGARGSRAAKQVAAQERREGRLIADGALASQDEVRERVQSEAMPCPHCGTPVHPSNWTAHMNLYHADSLIVDPEFRDLIPAQTEEERTALEESLKAEGCRDALVVWQNILIDGHHRHEICTRLNIPFQTIEREFESRDDVIVWMIANQLARRNLTPFVRGELALRSKAAIQRKAKERQGHGQTAPGKTLSQNSGEAFRSDKALANLANTSHDTIRKVEQITADAPEQIKRKARKGELSINRAHLITKALRGAAESVVEAVAKYDVDEPETVNILRDLHRNGRESFNELATSGKVYGAGEEFVLITDSPAKIRQTLDKRAEQHRRIAAEARRFQRETPPDDLPEQQERFKLLTGSLADVLPQLPDASIDAIITDPPYSDEYTPLYGVLAKEAARLLKPGASLIVMCGQSYFPEVLAQMTPHIRYHWLVSYLTPGGQAPQIWQRKVNTFWKPVLWFVNGDYADGWIGDVVKSAANDNDKRFHAWGQSESGMSELITRFTHAGQTILDPFLGGGTTGVVSLALNRQFIGVDSNPECVQVAHERIASWLRNTK